ncbi:MAG TPA: hypothetical protein VKU00_30295, partial [Chthonomonadaceae bacterium]|nr:hypothetical protein [Chthonomonadaceae bacterium]
MSVPPHSLSKLLESAAKDRFGPLPLRAILRTALLALALPLAGRASGQAAPLSPPIEVTLPSAAPSGNPIVDRIWLTFYPAAAAAGRPAPAVVVLPMLGEEGDAYRLMQQFGRYLAQHGIGAAVMTL